MPVLWVHLSFKSAGHYTSRTPLLRPREYDVVNVFWAFSLDTGMLLRPQILCRVTHSRMLFRNGNKSLNKLERGNNVTQRPVQSYRIYYRASCGACHFIKNNIQIIQCGRMLAVNVNTWPICVYKIHCTTSEIHEAWFSLPNPPPYKSIHWYPIPIAAGCGLFNNSLDITKFIIKLVIYQVFPFSHYSSQTLLGQSFTH